LNELVRYISSKNKKALIEYDRNHPGVGGCGYGINLFGDVFSFEMEETAPLVNSALHFTVGVIDTKIDENDTSNPADILEESYLLFADSNNMKSSEFSYLAPFIDFIQETTGNDAYENILKHLEDYKNAAIEEIKLEKHFSGISSEKKKNNRIDIGKIFANICLEVMDCFALSRKLEENEKNCFRFYSSACSLADDISDVFSDIYYGKEKFIVSAAREKRKGILATSYEELKNLNKIFLDGENSLSDPLAQKKYRTLVRMAKSFYLLSFFKKLHRYGREVYRSGFDIPLIFHEPKQSYSKMQPI